MNSPRIALLGMGEDAMRIAVDVRAAGAEVTMFDIKPPKRPHLEPSESIEAAIAQADVVLSLNSSAHSLSYARGAAGSMTSGALFADLNPGTPRLKLAAAELFAPHVFVDVALLDPMLASGSAAGELRDVLASVGLGLEVVSDRVGDAAARALTRSILTKCLAGVVVDYMWAAEKMGLTDWAYEELQREFDASTAATARNYLRESGRDVKRREIEMLDVVEMLESVDYHSLFVPPTQLVYNKVYHSIRVPFSETEED